MSLAVCARFDAAGGSRLGLARGAWRWRVAMGASRTAPERFLARVSVKYAPNSCFFLRASSWRVRCYSPSFAAMFIATLLSECICDRHSSSASSQLRCSFCVPNERCRGVGRQRAQTVAGLCDCRDGGRAVRMPRRWQGCADAKTVARLCGCRDGGRAVRMPRRWQGCAAVETARPTCAAGTIGVAGGEVWAQMASHEPASSLR